MAKVHGAEAAIESEVALSNALVRSRAVTSGGAQGAVPPPVKVLCPPPSRGHNTLQATILYIKLTVQFTLYAKENLILFEILLKIF